MVFPFGHFSACGRRGRRPSRAKADEKGAHFCSGRASGLASRAEESQRERPWEAAIRTRLAAVAKLGAMRPGTLTVQYRNPGEHKTPFHQISYTHKGRSRSEYVRPENLSAVRREIQTYKRFRRLVDEIIDLSLEASRLRHQRR